MNKLYYNVSLRPSRYLLLGHRYDHNNLTVIFEGFTRVKDNSTIYVKMGSPIEAMVPLSDDNELVVQNYMTKESTRGIPCQLVEYGLKDGEEGTYELINSSKVFYACVDESVAEGETPEVTDPSLDLIYTQMHEMYLTVKNAYESGEFKGEKGDKGDTGDKGAEGHTPIKGTDYWTDADKQEIVNDTVEAMQPVIDAETERATNAETELREGLNKKTDETKTQEIREAVLELYTSLENYYTKSEAYSQEEINDLISKIPKFAIEVVTTLPTSDISETTVYLLKTSETETDNLYTEYIYIGGKWEMLGTQKLDLSNYYKSAEVDKLVENEKTARQNADTALETKITDEVKTARKAEETLETKLSDEVTRATTAETTLQTSINEEATARENADKALETKISDTDSKKVGYQEVQGNTLYMYSDDTKAVLLATLELPAAPVQDVQINGSSIVTDGVANVPIAADSKPGAIGLSSKYGVSITSANNLLAMSRTSNEYTSMAMNTFISKGTLSNIQQSYVDGILCSTDETKALTTEQQIAARERIGARTKSGWTKVATITDPNGGDILNLEGYDELYLYGNLVTSNLSWLYFLNLDGVRITQIYNNITGVDSNKTLFIHLFNTPLGVDINCKYSRATDSLFGGILSTAYASAKKLTVADIAKMTFQYPDYVTTLSLDVYAK